MYSGHTNVNSLLRAVREKRDLTIGFHEYLTSIMLCDREYFSEAASDILNLFAVDGTGDASHFNRLAVLGRVLRDRGGTAGPGHGFTPIRAVVEDCESIGVLPETTCGVIQLFVARGVFQTDTQIREDLSASEFIRATSAALYYLEHLVFEAAYLETVLYDTPVGNQQSFDRLSRLTKQAEESEQTGERLNRLRFRLDRTAAFIDYLVAEYATSRLAKAGCALMDPLAIDLPSKIKSRFETERKAIFRQAKELIG